MIYKDFFVGGLCGFIYAIGMMFFIFGLSGGFEKWIEKGRNQIPIIQTNVIVITNWGTPVYKK